MKRASFFRKFIEEGLRKKTVLNGDKAIKFANNSTKHLKN
jgi:hypothetical protein